MYNKHTLLWPVLFLAVSLACAAFAAPTKEAAFRIQLPRDIAPEQITILIGEYGKGLSVSQVSLKKGIYEHAFPLWKEMKTLKLLAYAPGYQIVTKELTRQEALAAPFALQFEPLPTAQVTLRFIDSQGKPVAGEKLTLQHTLAEMAYFGYMGGMIHPATLATATTDEKGEITLRLPLLAEDPHYAKYIRDLTYFGINISGQRDISGHGWDFTPSSIPARKSYTAPIVITKRYCATLRVQVEDSFLKQHGIERSAIGAGSEKDHLVLYYRQVDSRGSANMPVENGIYTRQLPPGEYQLAFELYGPGGKRLNTYIPIKEHCTLGEREEKTLVVK